MKLAIYHGYELTGSGSNEYTRYLARTLASQGHQVCLICREPNPESIEFVSRTVSYSADGNPTEWFRRKTGLAGEVSLHRLPETSCYPVYVKDKQRPGNVKAFPEMTDDELRDYRETILPVVRRVLHDERPDVLHANHLVYQPQIALAACKETGTPFYIVPHGSAIEYTVKQDVRFQESAREALAACAGVVWITDEVRDRVCRLFPDLRGELLSKSRRVGVGTDTSLFRPIAIGDRGQAIRELKALHKPGGKPPILRRRLRERLDRDDIRAMTDYRDAYDHSLPDHDLPEILDRIPVDKDLLIFVGSLTYGKGVQSLIAAMPGILRNHPDTHLLIVGSGTYREVLEGLIHAVDTGNEWLFDEIVSSGLDLETGDMTGPLEDLQAHAADPARRKALFRHGRGLAQRVHFLGRLNHPMLRCVFPCCKLSVFPSVIHEASPLVFYESMANGVLPSGSGHSGLREGIDDLRPFLPEEIGRSIELPTDNGDRVAGIAERIGELLGSTKTVGIGDELRRLVVERHDWQAVARSLTEAIVDWAEISVETGEETGRPSAELA